MNKQWYRGVVLWWNENMPGSGVWMMRTPREIYREMLSCSALMLMIMMMIMEMLTFIIYCSSSVIDIQPIVWWWDERECRCHRFIQESVQRNNDCHWINWIINSFHLFVCFVGLLFCCLWLRECFNVIWCDGDSRSTCYWLYIHSTLSRSKRLYLFASQSAETAPVSVYRKCLNCLNKGY